MTKNGIEPTRRNVNITALGPLLEAYQEIIRAEKVWR
jgi:hypothetical protein